WAFADQIRDDQNTANNEEDDFNHLDIAPDRSHFGNIVSGIYVVKHIEQSVYNDQHNDDHINHDAFGYQMLIGREAEREIINNDCRNNMRKLVDDSSF